MLMIVAPLGMPVPETVHLGCRMAVDGMLMMMFDPVVRSPEEVNWDGLASAARITWPFGRIAAGASVPPKGEEIPFSVPMISGPAAHVLVDGV